MLCVIFLGIICCRVLKNVVVVEDVLNIGGEKVSELMCSDSYFEVDIDYKLEGVNTVYVINYGKRWVLKVNGWVVHVEQYRGLYLVDHHL